MNNTNFQDFVFLMTFFGVAGAMFIGAGLITPNTFIAGFFYWVGASCIATTLWLGLMLSRKKEPEDEFTLLVNEAEHWEKPNWIIANSGPLDAGMMTMLMGGEYIKDRGDIKIVRTEYVKQFLEENNENI